MKKLLTNSFLILVINGFISATPGNRYTVKSIGKTSIEKPKKLVILEEIHPLYILEYRFN